MGYQMANKNYQIILTTLLTIPLSAICQININQCGSLENGYGPFDYRKTDAARRSIVEKFHFTSKVETLRGGSTASTPGGDLAYTLRAFPNHPSALMATIRFAEQTKRNPPRDDLFC
jgi:hypothetical protein